MTFDQPLYHKALNILTADGCEFKDIVLRLGGFHTMMCFLSAIGDCMKNSGIFEVMSLVYADGSVSQIMVNG